jgi:hypothetical protein
MVRAATDMLINGGELCRTLRWTRTSTEQIPRIFHGLKRHVSTLFCLQLPSRRQQKMKNVVKIGTLMVDAQGIEPWTSPV